MLGMAFHPVYGVNGYFFVCYTNSAGDLVVSRYTKNSTNPDLANSATEKIIITIPHPTYQNHNGGNIAFGPDGYLYIGTGDGGGSGDPNNNSQNKNSLLGKILRIDIDTTNAYAVPSDNPFVGQANVRTEIWALGLRNPWRFSFDRQTGDLFIADVGQGAWEEINLQSINSAGGENYGWRCYEGFATYNTSGCAQASTYNQPISVYDHSNSKCSITGGYMYRGNAYPQMRGYYIFADYCNGQIFSIVPGTGNNWTQEIQGQYAVNLSSFGQNVSGELYAAGYNNGVIYRVQASASSDTTPPTVSLTAPTNGANLTGTTTVSANASDNVAVFKVDFLIDGTIINTDTIAPYSFSWSTATYSNAAHTVVARATDSAGNFTNTSQISVNTQNQPLKIGDTNGDNQVNLIDLSVLLSNYGYDGSVAQGDNNGDGKITIVDLSRLLSNYGT
jgi:glucose/arabinose dehydrogenase